MAIEIEHIQFAGQLAESSNSLRNGHIDDASIVSITTFTIKPIVRRKLHVSLDPNDTSPQNLDGLELVSDIQAMLIARIQHPIQPDRGDQQIRDLKSYATTVASNVCYQYFRSKYPVRTQQTNKLRYLLTHHGSFSVWKDRGERLVCGYHDWELLEMPAATLKPELEVPPKVTAGNGRSNARDELTRMLESVFDQMEMPVYLDDLVFYIMEMQGIFDAVLVRAAIERDGYNLEENVADRRPDAEAEMETRERLRGLWKGIANLPLRHRLALLLNLRCREGEGLIAIFPTTGTASIKAIARALDFLPEEFAVIWNSLPWDDRQIADHLKLTRQQVINLRQSARIRLARFFREY